MKKRIIGICIAITLITGFAIFNSSGNNKLQSKDADKIDQKGDKNIHDKKVYSTIETEKSWSFDVSNTSNMLNYAEYVVKAKVTGIGDGTFKYSDNFTPVTPVFIDTIEVLKGNNEKEINTIYKFGGYVTIKQVIDASPESRSTKMGLDKLTEEEQNNLYMNFTEGSDYDLEIGKTYIFTLSSKNTEGICYIAANGYSIFEVSDDDINPLGDNAPKTYKNVLTGNELVIE